MPDYPDTSEGRGSLMDQSKLKYTWRFPKRSKYIRMFCWIWAVRDSDLTFCSLFWGTLFAPVVLPLRLLYLPFGVGAPALGHKMLAAGNAVADRLPEKKVKPPKPEKSVKPKRKPKVTPDQVANFFVQPRVRKVFKLAFLALGVAVVGFVGYLLVLAAPSIWYGITVAVAAVVTGVAWLFTTGVPWLFENPLVWLKVVSECLAIIAIVVVGILAVVGTVFVAGSEFAKALGRGFGHCCGTGMLFLLDGVTSVKRNTCPRIVLDDGDKVRAAGDD
jgi:MFS family permease